MTARLPIAHVTDAQLTPRKASVEGVGAFLRERFEGRGHGIARRGIFEKLGDGPRDHACAAFENELAAVVPLSATEGEGFSAEQYELAPYEGAADEQVSIKLDTLPVINLVPYDLHADLVAEVRARVEVAA